MYERQGIPIVSTQKCTFLTEKTSNYAFGRRRHLLSILDSKMVDQIVPAEPIKRHAVAITPCCPGEDMIVTCARQAKDKLRQASEQSLLACLFKESLVGQLIATIVPNTSFMPSTQGCPFLLRHSAGNTVYR